MSNSIALKRSKLSISSPWFVLITACYFGFILNYAVSTKIIGLAENTSSGLFAYTAPLLLSSVFVIIFSLFTIPYLTRLIFSVLIITSALASYATLNYGVIFDYSMIENIFETNTSEASSYLSLKAVVYFLAFGVAPTVLLWLVKFEKKHTLKVRIMQRIALLFGALVVIAVIYITSYKDYASVGRNNSYLNKLIVPSHVYYTAKYLDKTYFSTPLEYRQIGLDSQKIVSANGKPELTVLVLGETARSMNLGINGYEKNTTPYTKKYDMISFTDVSSCGTATAHSLPCMFSNMPREGYRKAVANAQDNVLDIIQRAGVSVLWKDNDGGDKAVAKNLAKKVMNPAEHPKSCTSDSCYDEVLLQDLDAEVSTQSGKDQLYVLHFIGSHGPTYWKRYPEHHELFTPSCNRADIENCSDEEIRNVYDNTIAYTDFLISQLIEKLKVYGEDYNVALMYISDHGESLGENGLYLHGTPYALAPKEQTTVPWLLWLDDRFAQSYGINKACVADKSHQALSHDNLFHTLLDFVNVSTAAKDKSMSILDTCRRL
ncbi:phosphoethanolamine transferase [Vibrio ziniensis]|uniref:Phosphoethanolamine--lipid A transferase n=1 Tax=Vibrio ziniensis TaxID=2711221 RepID=A0A6G7CPE2_9VIBR|nr:phosphoethanolamine--lipid A transferase [Vibrio ziniensis]QIH43923.1 phosphoethanolamine--lipid A transferase [Vibrio ziniensis]